MATSKWENGRGLERRHALESNFDSKHCQTKSFCGNHTHRCCIYPLQPPPSRWICHLGPQIPLPKDAPGVSLWFSYYFFSPKSRPKGGTIWRCITSWNFEVYKKGGKRDKKSYATDLRICLIGARKKRSAGKGKTCRGFQDTWLQRVRGTWRDNISSLVEVGPSGGIIWGRGLTTDTFTFTVVMPKKYSSQNLQFCQ